MADKTIEIPQIRLTKMIVTIQGETPLITHRFGDRALAEISAKQQKKAKLAKEARNPEAEFRDALYAIDVQKGVYGFPASGIKKALVYAGGRFADEQMTVLRGLLNVQGDKLAVRGSAPRMREDPVRLSGGIMSIAYRPEFDPWEIDVPVVFNSGLIGEAQVVNLFQIAGFSVGIGDWRPEKNGTFGTFSVKGVSAK